MSMRRRRRRLVVMAVAFSELLEAQEALVWQQVVQPWRPRKATRNSYSPRTWALCSWTRASRYRTRWGHRAPDRWSNRSACRQRRRHRRSRPYSSLSRCWIWNCETANRNTSNNFKWYVNIYIICTIWRACMIRVDCCSLWRESCRPECQEDGQLPVDSSCHGTRGHNRQVDWAHCAGIKSASDSVLAVEAGTLWIGWFSKKMSVNIVCSQQLNTRCLQYVFQIGSEERPFLLRPSVFVSKIQLYQRISYELN